MKLELLKVSETPTKSGSVKKLKLRLLEMEM